MTNQNAQDSLVNNSRALDEVLAHLRFIQAVEWEAWGRRKRPLYLGPVDFVLREGRTWTPARLPRGIRLGERGQCYKNAFNLALRNRITYVEGYAGDVVPIAHAWCIDEEGRVVDNTWSDSEQCVYFGVAFDSKYVESTVLRQRVYGLIDMPETGWPLITGQHENWRHRSLSNAD